MALLHFMRTFFFHLEWEELFCNSGFQQFSNCKAEGKVVRTCHYSSHPAKQLIGVNNLADVHSDSVDQKEKLLMKDWQWG